MYHITNDIVNFIVYYCNVFSGESGLMKKHQYSMLRPLTLLITVLLACNSSFAQTLFPVPNIPGVCGVSGCIVSMAGGSGGASNSSGTGFPDGGPGGKAGIITCTLNVATPVVITSLTYYVGMAGATGVPIYVGTTGAAGGTGYGHGGNAGNFAGPSGFVGTDVSGGGGGGSSAVLNTSGGTVMLVAAGGGGGGALTPSVYGGDGGAVGATGGSYAPNFGGTGGTPGVFGAAGGAGITYPGAAAGAAAPGDGGNGGTGPTGSQSAGGGGAGYGGGGGGGAGNTVFAGVNTITAGGGGGANYVSPTALTTSLTNGTATTTGNGYVNLTLYPAIASTTGVVFCTGGTSTFTETTPGGVWSSSDATIATVSSSVGTSITVTGVSAGTANISYTAGGYWSYVCVTVNAGASPIIGPTNVCATQTISLTDTTGTGTWSASPTSIATISPTGVLTGVTPGVATVTYTLPSGCNVTTPITVNPFPTVIGGTLAICEHSTTILTDGVPGGTWTSSDPLVATIDPSTGLVTGVSAGFTTITYGFTGNCAVNTGFTVYPTPLITNTSSTDPTTCFGTDGTITLDGMIPSTAYVVNYDYNGTPATPLTITANAVGLVRMNIPSTGLLAAGVYNNINVTNTTTGCTSPSVGPITLTDPPNPPTPAITYQPLCEHQTLMLQADDAWPGGTYSWTGPDGFTSTLSDPIVLNATAINAGIYSVVYTLLNCQSLPGTANVIISSPPQLTNVTPDQTISYGSSIQLDARNARFYMWVPNDGSLSNPNVNNPIASPLVTTTYTVFGMNEFGCRDSAYVTITVDSVGDGGIPTAFTPNNDGHNDVFHLIGFKFHHLVEFRIFNRWGQEVFYTTDIKKGWDGTYNGVPQEMGIYYYQVIVAEPDNMVENKAYKGSVTLIR